MQRPYAVLFCCPLSIYGSIRYDMGDGWRWASQGFRGPGTKPWLVSALEIRFRRKVPFPRLLKLACSIPARFLLDLVSYLGRGPCKGDACFGCCRQRHQGRAAQRHSRWASQDSTESTSLPLHRDPFCIM